MTFAIRSRNGRCLWIVLTCAAIASSTAQSIPRDSTVLTLQAFADAYYAYDFQRPPNRDRAFTTQPARHNEFNVNLAFVGVRLSSARVRGRVAVQTGTSVQLNYAAEPIVGVVSGPDVTRFLQEGTIGGRVMPNLWIDGGVFLSHIGAESWISSENRTYTRSLVADYTPYYESGVRATWSPRASVTAQLNVVNGWQIVSENNDDKAIGIRVDYTPAAWLTLSYDNFIGNERPDTLPSGVRSFHEVIVKARLTDRLETLVSVQRGSEPRPSRNGTTSWGGGAAVARVNAGRGVALSARLERFSDPEQAIAATGLGDGLVAWGGSIGVDVGLGDQMLWRTEYRALAFDQPIYPSRSPGGLARSSALLVTAVSLSASALVPRN